MFNLERDSYVVFLAEGNFNNGRLEYHRKKIKSASPVALGIAANLAGASKLFIQVQSVPVSMTVQPFLSTKEKVKSKNGCTVIHSGIKDLLLT